MKKSIIYSSALVAPLFLVGCASEDYSVQSVEKNDPVEIHLAAGTMNMNSRASIESVGVNNAFECDNLAFFMLAKDKTGVNSNALDISWSPSSESGFYAAWWDNVPGKATISYVDGIAQTNLVTTQTGQHAYYPTANWYTYDFYAYQPRVGSTMLSPTSALRRRAQIVIDGTQDVIWGKATSDAPLAYCAKYFNQPEHADEIPDLIMGHKMMRLQFAVVAGADGTGSYAGALAMGIKSIEIIDCPTIGTLTIADRNNPALEGNLSFDWAQGLVDLAVRDANDAEFTGFDDHRVTMDQTNVGQGIIIPVPEDPTYIYRVKITMQDENGIVYECERPLELTSSNVYKAGNSYTVVMTVRGPKEIKVKPSLTPWENSSTPIELEFD